MGKELDRFLGVMFGGAVGDTLGEPAEFLTRDTFPWISSYQHQNPTTQQFEGEWTDDTAMALLLADSLVRCKGSNIRDQLDNYLKWHLTGYMGTRNYPAGEGIQIAKKLEQYKDYLEGTILWEPWDFDMSGRYQDGNGCLMRIGPIPLFFYSNVLEAMKGAEESCISTHNTIICRHACSYYAGLIRGALHGMDKKELLSPFSIKGYRDEVQMCPEVLGVVEGSYACLKREELVPSGYVVDSMEAALWGFYHYDTFKDGLEAVVNLGGDADTIGCIYGYLAGAYYGFDAIPRERIDGLMYKERIEEMTMKLFTTKQ